MERPQALADRATDTRQPWASASKSSFLSLFCLYYGIGRIYRNRSDLPGRSLILSNPRAGLLDHRSSVGQLRSALRRWSWQLSPGVHLDPIENRPKTDHAGRPGAGLHCPDWQHRSHQSRAIPGTEARRKRPHHRSQPAEPRPRWPRNGRLNTEGKGMGEHLGIARRRRRV